MARNKLLVIRVDEATFEKVHGRAKREAASVSEVGYRFMRRWGNGEIDTPPNNDDDSE